jgi:hypothetical protein
LLFGFQRFYSIAIVKSSYDFPRTKNLNAKIKLILNHWIVPKRLRSKSATKQSIFFTFNLLFKNCQFLFFPNEQLFFCLTVSDLQQENFEKNRWNYKLSEFY